GIPPSLRMCFLPCSTREASWRTWFTQPLPPGRSLGYAENDPRSTPRFEDRPMSTPSPVADGNLIFGLLALQMDFVTREQLLEAMHAWMLHKSTPLGAILCERGTRSPRRSALLDEMVEEPLAQHGGDAQASLAALRVEPDVRASLASLDDADIQASLAPA